MLTEKIQGIKIISDFGTLLFAVICSKFTEILKAYRVTGSSLYNF